MPARTNDDEPGERSPAQAGPDTGPPPGAGGPSPAGRTTVADDATAVTGPDERTAAVRRTGAERATSPADPGAPAAVAGEPAATTGETDERTAAVRRIGTTRPAPAVPDRVAPAAPGKAAATAPTATARPGASAPGAPASAELTAGKAPAPDSEAGDPPRTNGSRPGGPAAHEPSAQEPVAHGAVADESTAAVRRIGAERTAAAATATDTARPGPSAPRPPASAELATGKAAAVDSEAGDPPRTNGSRPGGPAGPDAHEPDAHDTVSHGPVGDERVAAVRRVSAAGRRWRGVRLVGCAALLAVALTGGAIALGAARDQGSVAVAASSGAVDPGALGSGDLDAGIAALQSHLRSQPKDAGSWATLGLAYVEQARTKGDPARYPQAEKALKRSLSLTPGNDQALAGRAALAAARHDFKDALVWSDQALRRNPYSERALSSRIDALVELGRYADAAHAARTADDRRPGVPVFTRYAYVYELRGDVTTARRVLRQALTAATSPGDVAYVAAQLGQLAWNQGRYSEALGYYARALAADDNYLPALEGRARAQAATGRRDEAIEGLRTVVARYPLPGPLVELGELYEARGGSGDRARAREQYALVDAWIALARANGVNADLDTALAAADHGDKVSALRAARAEWARRHTVHTADALAWALHVNGHDTEALGYARRATATGYRSAAFRYHRGMIELATGHTAAGRASLRAALQLNPGFSPLGAAAARKALEAAE